MEAVMRHIHVKCLAGLAVVAIAAVGAAGPAEARIKCQGNFQVTKYGLISTPYCEEEQIAAVARSYGVKVSGAEVRNDALKKVRLCQRFGGDTRLKGSCAGYAPEQYR
jgi:hypothetical protein